MSAKNLSCLAVLAISALVALAACRATPESGSDPKKSSGSRLAKPYPLESFDSVALDGTKISLAAWKNQAVIINVWATWCAPCRRELPMLEALQAKYRDRVRVLGVLQDNVTDDFARQFAQNARLTFPIIRSTFEIESKLPAIVVIPMTYVVDSAGQLVSMFAGEVDATALDEEIQVLLSPSVHRSPIAPSRQ